MFGTQLRRRMHPSWIITWCSLGIIIGITTAPQWAVFSSLAWLLTGSVLCVAVISIGKIWLVPLAILGGIFVGIWRGSTEQVSLTVYDLYVGKTIAIEGVVGDDIDINTRGQSVIRLRSKIMNGESAPGSIWVTTNDKTLLRRGDEVVISGRLEKGFGSFAGSIYGADIKSVARTSSNDKALQARDRFAAGVRTALTDTESSLGLGYLVGQRRGLPEDLDVALTAAGLTHIVVASGYNLTILVRLARRLFEKISKYLSLLASGTMIVSFIAITGMSPSMSRAGLVTGLSLLAWYYGRRFHPIVLLCLAMAITLLLQPSYAWGDLGWQLSFAAFAGVMILAPLLQVYLFGDKPERPLRRIFIETMAATIATLPIIIGSFEQVSIIAPLANMAVLPLVPLAMLLTFVAGMGGLIVPAVAHVIGFPAQLLLTYMTQSAMFFGSLPWAVQPAELPPMGVVLVYSIIIAACVYMQRITGYQLRKSSLVE